MVCAMSDPLNERDEPADGDEHGDGPPPTPFDHPLFLPIILLGLSVWFGYDGWLNNDEHMQDHLTFNRVGFGVLVVAGAWYSYKAWREIKAKREQASAVDEGGLPPVS